MAVVWLLTVFGILYVIQRQVFRRWGTRGIRYKRTFSHAYAFAGQRVTLIEEIVNAKLLPMPWVRVETMMPSWLRFDNSGAEMTVSSGQLLQNHASLFSLSPFTKVLRKHEVTCARRGVFRISSLTCSLGDLLGTPAGHLTFAADAQIVVFPRLKEVGDLPASVRQFMQSAIGIQESFREDHFQVAGVRAYRSGDSLKQVNWSATAKTGELLVNKRETMADNDVILVLNAELLDDSEHRRIFPKDFEEALSGAASIASRLIEGGGKVGLVFNGRVEGLEEVPLRVEPRAGREHLFRLLGLMSRFEAATRRELTYVLEEMAASGLRDSRLLLMTAFLTPKQKQLVDRLRAAGNRVETMLLYREATA
ncbi:DUF58 domain-containing protein [Cohnella zeiphila]|uniref:DUF58 domain-containing protein n=1 Tax=Cohnella zeiphila TaxID=2761120 RepID=A0A7X0STV6_9BACL|nr:DUF58 domain-containing protein [Cohnella zeiphila]MBB6733788.1 DUF58 domain-containing protein [Cohnella zeiphila]